jgi:hypothetical protein
MSLFTPWDYSCLLMGFMLVLTSIGAKFPRKGREPKRNIIWSNGQKFANLRTRVAGDYEH